MRSAHCWFCCWRWRWRERGGMLGNWRKGVMRIWETTLHLYRLPTVLLLYVYAIRLFVRRCEIRSKEKIRRFSIGDLRSWLEPFWDISLLKMAGGWGLGTRDQGSGGEKSKRYAWCTKGHWTLGGFSVRNRCHERLPSA